MKNNKKISTEDFYKRTEFTDYVENSMVGGDGGGVVEEAQYLAESVSAAFARLMWVLSNKVSKDEIAWIIGCPEKKIPKSR